MVKKYNRECSDLKMRFFSFFTKYLPISLRIESMNLLQPHPDIKSESLGEFRSYLTGNTEVPKLPMVLQEVLDCSRDANTNAEKLAVIIATDSVISAQLLKTVNSAYYGFPKQIASIKHAVVLLGFSEVTNLAVGLALMGLMQPKKPDPFYHQFRIHSLATAQLSLWLAEKVAFKDKTTIYTSGLLHDFGLLMLYAWQPEKYRQVLSRSQAEKIPIYRLERTMLGLDHLAAGSLIGQLWHLPALLTLSMRCHHEKNSMDQPEALFLAIIQMAHVLSYQLGFPLSRNLATPKLPAAAYQLLKKVQPELSRENIKLWLLDIKPQLAQIPSQASD